MANDAKVVCKNVFKNCDRAAFTKAFTLKWIELINQYEKNKGKATHYVEIVCFVFSKRRTKHDRIKIKSCYLLPLIRGR